MRASWVQVGQSFCKYLNVTKIDLQVQHVTRHESDEEGMLTWTLYYITIAAHDTLTPLDTHKCTGKSAYDFIFKKNYKELRLTCTCLHKFCT